MSYCHETSVKLAATEPQSKNSIMRYSGYIYKNMASRAKHFNRDFLPEVLWRYLRTVSC